MTTPLNFFIAPLSSELQARTLVAHNARGICLYLTKGLHACELAYTLGLANKLHWYSIKPYESAAPDYMARQILRVASEVWAGGLDLNTRMLWHRMSSMTLAEQQQCIVLINRFIYYSRWESTLKGRLAAMQQSDKVPADVLSRLEMALASLEQSLLDKDPLMPQHLRNTHALLISYPETVHLLSDADIAKIIDAAEIHTKTEIVKQVAAGKGSKKKMSIEDL